MISDEKWQKVMDSTDGHKVARALYESLWRRSQEFGFTAPSEMISWENQVPGYKDCLIAVAGDLFDYGVIEGGHALPKLYNETGNPKPQST